MNEVRPILRDMRGRWQKGTAPGPGNPHARLVQRLRGMFLDAVSEDDIKLCLEELRRIIREGSPRERILAIHEFLNRSLGESGQILKIEADDEERPTVDRSLLTKQEFEALARMRQSLIERSQCPDCELLGRPCARHSEEVQL